MADVETSLASKHSAIVALWRDCPRPGVNARAPGDAAVANSGRWADLMDELSSRRADAIKKCRGLIEVFVRKHWPRGHADGFTASELAEINANRAAVDMFAPYD